MEAFDEIYTVDGNSTDGTKEYLEARGIPVYIQPRKGLNAAIVFAFEKCTTEALVIFHPKGTTPPEDTARFKELFENGHRFVLASRNSLGGINDDDDDKLLKPRKWFVTFLAIIASLIWRREGNIIWDVLHGFRGATVKAFKQMEPLDYGLSIDIEMVIRSYRKRIPRIEFPTIERRRPYRETHFKALPTGLRILRYLLHEIRRTN